MRAVMLAVDGDQFGAGGSHGRRDQLAARDQNLFIRQPDALAQADGFVGGFQTLHAHNGGHDESGLWSRGGGDSRPRAGGQLRLWDSVALSITCGGSTRAASSATTATWG